MRRSGKWIPGRCFHLQVAERGGEASCSRLGLAVSRRVGPAVTRNRIKRRFRELFRGLSGDFAQPVDLVVIARRGVDRLPFSELKQQFTRALRPWLRAPLQE